MGLLKWLTLKLGRPAGRLMLYPICLYFVVFSRGTRGVSYAFLSRVLKRRIGFGYVFLHFYAFAATLHDRVYLLSGRHEYFDIHVEGIAALNPLLDRGRGCMLLGSHLGSFEILRAYGMFEKKLPINVLMHERAAAQLNDLVHGLNPDVRERIIPLGRPETMLVVKERLERGEIIGILGDRTFHDDKTVACRFFGEDVLFPAGPILLAGILKAPVVLFFGLYRGGRRYDIHFELFTELLGGDGRPGPEEIRSWVQRYVNRLEHYCRLAPYNWFNFYDFMHPSYPT
ncbi:MAG: LpxL/LpxP family acyltransferase [Nitrospiraceae bacterium]